MIFPPSTWRRRSWDTTSPIPSHLYNLTDQELDAVKKKLLELKPNIRKMWSTGRRADEPVSESRSGRRHGLAAEYHRTSKKQNFPVGETIPKENTTGWIDHLMITAGSENKELAHQFLEYMVQAKTQKLVDRRDRLHARESAGRAVHDRRMKSRACISTTSTTTRSGSISGKTSRAAPKYNEIWNEVKAAQ